MIMINGCVKYVRTDLACESGRIDPENYVHAKYSRRDADGVTVERLSVGDDEGERETGKRKGTYVTVSNVDLKGSPDGLGAASSAVSEELRTMIVRAIGKEIAPETSVLVAGLGNRHVTPDALGARCADKINATRHVMGKYGVFRELGCSSVSIVAPGVLAETGIESSELIKGAADRVSADLVIAIDAMAARKVSRLATTIQISDAGISPGRGIGNRRPALDRETLGRPVISIGSPTVVDSATLVYDALEQAGADCVTPELERILDEGKSFFVSPNDSDVLIERLSDVISSAVNRSLGTSFSE